MGFYSCAQREIRFKGQATYCVYQHHYRVHPDYRAGSVSQALASHVDPRRSFESAEFPYSLIDPNNVHMRHAGFPEVEGVRITRLSIPVAAVAHACSLEVPTAKQIVEQMNQTHADHELYLPFDEARLAERCNKVPSYSRDSFRSNASAVLGVWRVNERNVMEHDGIREELRLAFVFDYGYTHEEAFVALVRGICAELVSEGTTHLCFLCDTRSVTYKILEPLASDIQRFAIHTLPWITADLQAKTLYFDGMYC